MRPKVPAHMRRIADAAPACSRQDENDYNGANTSNAAADSSSDNDVCVAIKPFALQEHDKRNGCPVGTPQTAKRVRRSSDAQEVLQDVTFRLDGTACARVVCPRRQAHSCEGGVPTDTSRHWHGMSADLEPPTVTKPRREDKRMSVGFGLSLRNSCQDDFYAPKYSEAELETIVEERCAELQREHDRQVRG